MVLNVNGGIGKPGMAVPRMLMSSGPISLALQFNICLLFSLAT